MGEKKMNTISQSLVLKILEVVDCGLVFGPGNPIPGQMCVEAAVCFALGLPHGDNPPCVGESVRHLKICLNDSNWSSSETRAKGLRRLAIAQLGSNEINQIEFSQKLVLRFIQQILSLILEEAGLKKESLACKQAKDLITARYASTTAYASAFDAVKAVRTIKTVYVCEATTAAYFAITAVAYDYITRTFSISASNRAARTVVFFNAKDSILELTAELAVQVLVDMKCQGTEFLYLCN